MQRCSASARSSCTSTEWARCFCWSPPRLQDSSTGNCFQDKLSPMAAATTLTRQITIPTAIAVVIGNMIGSGIFGTSGFMARDLGSPAWLLGLWIVGGALALAGALSYSEMGAAMPEAGGEYVYLREAYGPLVGYLSGWTSFFIGFSGAIASAVILF